MDPRGGSETFFFVMDVGLHLERHFRDLWAFVFDMCFRFLWTLFLMDLRSIWGVFWRRFGDFLETLGVCDFWNPLLR